MKDLYVSWDEYHGVIEQLALSVHESGWRFDSLLCLAFFLQHSGMVRRGFRARISFVVPPRYHRAVYSIASGLVLTGVVLLWQPSGTHLLVLDGPFRLAAYAGVLIAVAVFIWGAFGTVPHPQWIFTGIVSVLIGFGLINALLLPFAKRALGATEFEYGLQGFGEMGKWDQWSSQDERVHKVGPAVFGKLPLGGRQAIRYNAAWLVGASNAAPDNTFRMQVEYEF